MMTWMVAALALTQSPIPEFGPELARRLGSGAPVIDFGGQTYRISSPVITRGLSRRHIRNLKLIDGTRPPASVPDYFISHPTVAWGMMNARDVILENVQLERPAWMGLGFIGGANVTLRRVSVIGGQGGRHPRHHVVVNRLTNLTIEDSRFVAGPQHDGELVGVGTGVPVHFRPNSSGELEAIEPHWRLETNFPAWIGTPDEVRLVRASGGKTLTIRYAGLSEVEGPADRHPLRWQVFWPGMDPTWSVRPVQRDSRAKTITLALRGARDATFPEGWLTWAAWNPAGMARGLTVRRTTFVGAGGKLAGLQRGSAGLSAYWVRDVVMEDNTATGFPDYGLGWEWCENVTVRGNRASGNQEDYNQYEFVGRARGVTFERNEGQLGFVPHGWPVEFVNVSHAGRVMVAGMDQLDAARPARRAALAIGWFQSVSVNGQPLGRPFLSIPPETLRQRGLLPDR